VVPDVNKISAGFSKEREWLEKAIADFGSSGSSMCDMSKTWIPMPARLLAIIASGGPSQRENLGLAARARVSTSNFVSRESIGMMQPPKLQIAIRSTKNSIVFP
jgi:hypothetical protein